MTAIVSVETVLLVLLVVLVAGLLRSHAEILRRLGPQQEDPGLSQPRPGERPDLSAAPVAGESPGGDAVALSFSTAEGGAPTLLAFLTSGCSTCAGFWETISTAELPPGVETLIVTHGRDRESPARIRRLAPPSVPVVMSSEAWADYRVPAAPYFVLVDGDVRGEGVATNWGAVSSLVRDAIEDDRDASATRHRGRSLDETFAAAGIGSGHPSLRPGEAEERGRGGS